MEKPNFTKRFRNDDYLLLFDAVNGIEVLTGVNGKEDPFSLELPSLLDVGIMGSCHNSCAFCYQGHTNRPNMSLDNFKMIVDQVAHHVNQIALGGHGDPNKHEHFREIVEYCKQNYIVPNYTTSGFQLTDEEIEISKMCGAVAVSDYEKDYTYDALTRLINNGIKTNIHQIFSKFSAQKCLNIANGEVPFWHGKFPVSNLNAVIFLLFKPQGAGMDLKEMLTPTYEQIREISRCIFESKAPFKIGTDSCLVNHMLNFIIPTKLQQMSIDTCEAARMSAYISPEMVFVPCSFYPHGGAQNLYNDNLQDIWKNSDLFDYFRMRLEKNRKICPVFE